MNTRKENAPIAGNNQGRISNNTNKYYNLNGLIFASRNQSISATIRPTQATGQEANHHA